MMLDCPFKRSVSRGELPEVGLTVWPDHLAKPWCYTDQTDSRHTEGHTHTVHTLRQICSILHVRSLASSHSSIPIHPSPVCSYALFRAEGNISQIP